jgi:hypothetical protein
MGLPSGLIIMYLPSARHGCVTTWPATTMMHGYETCFIDFGSLERLYVVACVLDAAMGALLGLRL